MGKSEPQLTGVRMKENSCRESSLKRRDILGISSALSASQPKWEKARLLLVRATFPDGPRACPEGAGIGGEDGWGRGDQPPSGSLSVLTDGSPSFLSPSF